MSDWVEECFHNFILLDIEQAKETFCDTTTCLNWMETTQNGVFYFAIRFFLTSFSLLFFTLFFHLALESMSFDFFLFLLFCFQCFPRCCCWCVFAKKRRNRENSFSCHTTHSKCWFEMEPRLLEFCKIIFLF